MAHEDDDESFDASDDGGTPHVGEHDVAILYAEQLERLAAAGLTAEQPMTLVGDRGPEVVTLPESGTIIPTGQQP